MRRVVITGAGSINALGAGVDVFAEGLRAARCGIGSLSLFDTSGYRTSCAAEIRALPDLAWMPQPVRRRASRSDVLALIAAREALLASRLDARAAEMGVVMGATTGGMHSSEEYYRQTLVGAHRRRRTA